MRRVWIDVDHGLRRLNFCFPTVQRFMGVNWWKGGAVQVSGVVKSE